jgi:Uncharacterized alpha/beta hydrolase domain (DUF2235)
MAKNIILLSDGTGNSSAKLNKTNVWRTYEALDCSNPQRQIVFYDNGVGTSAFLPKALLGGALGVGFAHNVRELYAHVCRNYSPGDRIHGFGFSRGAFTIRTLAGMITRIGILKRSAFASEAELKRKVNAVFRDYRRQHTENMQVPPLTSLLRGLRTALSRTPVPQAAELHPGHVEFLGLWDTVDAYGLPIQEMTDGWDRLVWPLSLRTFDLSAKVEKAAHALCLDDERNTFHPLLWNEAEETTGRLKQVWFAGMHSDVGGGYPDGTLSHVPLNWVLNEAPKQLLWHKSKLKDYQQSASALAPMHNSRSGIGAYYRLQPRKLAKLIQTGRGFMSTPDKINKSRSMDGLTSEDRVIAIAHPKIHHSVFDRISASNGAYSPIVLPPHYRWIDKSGVLQTTPHPVDPAPLERAENQERVWDLVWWRRWAYFITVFLTLCLALLPWMKSVPLLSGIWPLSAATDGDKCIESFACFLSGVPRALEGFLPGFAKTWVDSFSNNPAIFGGLAAAIGLLMYGSSWLDRKIHDGMRAIWSVPAAAAAPHSRIHALRESGWYTKAFKILKQQVLPLSFGLLSLVAIALAGTALVSRPVFSVMDAKGAFCEKAKVGTKVEFDVIAAKGDFMTNDTCWDSGLDLKQHATYRIVMVTETTWMDVKIEADLSGNQISHQPLIAATAWPFKRYVRENYLQPVARIFADGGQDEYVLKPTLKTTGDKLHCLVSDFEAKSGGRLFLFVNDAIIFGKPNAVLDTYGNNAGTAKVYVARINTIGQTFEIPPNIPVGSPCSEFVNASTQAGAQ